MKKRVYNWMLSTCPVCGKKYTHKANYKPRTCGNFDCLIEAGKRGLLKGLVGLEWIEKIPKVKEDFDYEAL